MCNRIITFLSTLALTAWMSAQIASIPGGYDMAKAENGMVVEWQLSSESRNATQVGIYDNRGKLVVALSPLQLVPEAKRVTISDISMLPGNIIAMSALFLKADNTVPAGSLLCFDFQGNLLSAVALSRSRLIRYLTVDSDANIWTLTWASGGQKPSEASLIAAYRPTGENLKELFKRSDFPVHAVTTKENQTLGVVGFGHTSNEVWFWLPGSNELVTFRASDSSFHRFDTGLPHLSSDEAPLKVVLTNSGTLLMETWGRQNSTGIGQRYLFARHAASKSWQQFYPPCSGCILAGANNDKAVFMKTQGDTEEIYEESVPE